MNDVTPNRDVRGQPTEDSLELERTGPAHDETSEPKSNVVAEERAPVAPSADHGIEAASMDEGPVAARPVEEADETAPPQTKAPSPPAGHGSAVDDARAIAESSAPMAVTADSPSVAAAGPEADGDGLAAAQRDVAAGGIGVLLVNLGTPDAADAPAVRRYLKEFLSDPRVIERTGWLWRFVLNWLILPLRPRRKARDYAKIWNKERNESPIKTITRSQAEKLAAILEPFGKHIVVDWAMRYGNPSIASRLEAVVARGCDRILVMPLYPQYAAATTATVCDEVFRYMMRLRKQPALRILPPYYDDPYYIEALTSSLQAEIKKLTFEPDAILVSYHGMPKEYVLKGDPYEGQCIRTTELMRERMGLDNKKMPMAFQSRFGRGAWLTPYTIKTVKQLARKGGVNNLVVVTPGFSADCLETLEEIAVENAHVFKRAGGKNFAAIPCLNDSEPGMLVIWQLALRELKGWV
jgi:ferrochelatase